MSKESEENKMKMTKAWKNEVVAKFESTETWESLKAVYVEYLSTEHTDKQEEFFDECFEKCAPAVKEKHVSMAGKAYTKTPEDTTDEYKEIIKALLEIEDIKLEQCGTWLYISGDTKKHLDEIHKFGEKLEKDGKGYRTKFCKKQKMWSVPPKNWTPKRGYHKAWSHEQVVGTYGQRFITDPDEA